MQDVVSLFPIFVWVAALVCAGLAIWRARRPITRGVIVDKLLRYLFFFPLGVQGLWAFSGHVFAPVEVAASIGWAPSPFQSEVGMANLGLGLASLYAAFGSFGARAAAAIAAACFLGGAGVVHLLEIAEEGNFAPGNAGPILVTDFLTPIVVLALLLLVPRRDVEPTAAGAAGPTLEDELENARMAIRDELRGGRH
ncbi:MAG: DUF6790 family protein [Methyloceanibacter sp.]|uniref:DUF6790 family protein n=1 Tax=Methyloceanibacter sp. TaxID=1965321 RepID=UPI003D9B9E71